MIKAGENSDEYGYLLRLIVNPKVMAIQQITFPIVYCHNWAVNSHGKKTKINGTYLSSINFRALCSVNRD